MKIAASILLLGIFSFNIFGYRIFYNYMCQKADEGLDLALDHDQYNDAALITIKKPVTLPYYTNSKTYQRMNGEVSVNGAIFKYVKLRIYNDSMEMLCIPHDAKTRIQNSKEQFFKLVNDFQQGNNGSKKSSDHLAAKSGISEFEEIMKSAISRPFMTLQILNFCEEKCYIPQTFPPSAERPPNALQLIC